MNSSGEERKNEMGELTDQLKDSVDTVKQMLKRLNNQEEYTHSGFNISRKFGDVLVNYSYRKNGQNSLCLSSQGKRLTFLLDEHQRLEGLSMNLQRREVPVQLDEKARKVCDQYLDQLELDQHSAEWEKYRKQIDPIAELDAVLDLYLKK